MFLCETCLALFPTAEDEQRAKETQRERDAERRKQLTYQGFVRWNARRRAPSGVHQASTDTLRCAAEAGCYVCAPVWEALKHYAPEDIDKGPRSHAIYRRNALAATKILDFSMLQEVCQR